MRPLVLGGLLTLVGCATKVDMAPVMSPDEPHVTVPYTGVRAEQFPDYGAIRANVLSAEGRAAAKGQK